MKCYLYDECLSTRAQFAFNADANLRYCKLHALNGMINVCRKLKIKYPANNNQNSIIPHLNFDKHQQEFIDCIINMDKHRQGIIVLNAPGGTGKTTVAKYLRGILHDVTFLAPTHKAANVLNTTSTGKKVQESLKAITIHKFLNAEPKYDDFGNVDYDFKCNNLPHNHIIFIDECSMLTRKMIDKFESISKNNLVIFMGDSQQLPPVEKNDDGKSEISKSFDSGQQFKFIKNLRTDNIDSAQLIEQIRNSCAQNLIPLVLNKIKIPNIINTFKLNQNSTAIVLAYSNSKVHKWNNLIRRHLFNVSEDDLKPYYINERLILGSTIRYSGLIKYYSSAIIEIKSIELVTVDLKLHTCLCERFDKKRLCPKHNLRYSNDNQSMKINFYKIIDQNGVDWYKPINKEVFKIWAKNFKNYTKLSVDGNWNETDGWKGYWSTMTLYNAILNYEYAQTVYKSQGSQYNTVFIDKNNILNCTNNDLLLKSTCYYTAASRMINNAYDIVF